LTRRRRKRNRVTGLRLDAEFARGVVEAVVARLSATPSLGAYTERDDMKFNISEPHGATFSPNHNEGGKCRRCGLDDKSHQFRCAECNKVLAGDGVCACGRCCMPSEYCHGAVYLYCLRTN